MIRRAVPAFDEPRTRQRLLEGFLLRLARADDPDAFVLRGSMLVRHWFPDVGRRTRDVDLLCALPYDPEAVEPRLRAILTDRSVDDGVCFDPGLRLDRLWPDSAHPGLRLFATGRADGGAGEMSVDLTFGMDVFPAACREELSLERGTARLWVGRPQMLVGRKLRVTADLSRRRWRPKDLGDLWCLLRRDPAPRPVLGEAIERSFDDGRPPAELLRPSWWSEPDARRRWVRYSRSVPGLPDRLEPVIDEVRARLQPVVRR